MRKEVAPGPDWMALSLSTKHASFCSPLKEEPQTVAPGQSLSTFQEEPRDLVSGCPELEGQSELFGGGEGLGVFPRALVQGPLGR